MRDWTPNLRRSDKPRYLAIADAIAEDIRSGRLAPADRLPPQRKLARRLDVDFTTVARGYIEAQKRGLIESHVGRGTFVRSSARRQHAPMARHPEIVDLSMNLPPEPDDPDLLDRMQDGLEAVGRDLVSLMRYQGFGGVAGRQGRRLDLAQPPRARAAAGSAVHRAGRASGAAGHSSACWPKPAMSSCRKPSPIPARARSPRNLAQARRAADGRRRRRSPTLFADACKRLQPKALYLNPTLLNPTTHTISGAAAARDRRVARRFGVPIVEDDPYGFLPTDGPPPFAASRRKSPGMWPGSPNASAPACGSPMWWRRMCAPAGCSPRRSAPRL